MKKYYEIDFIPAFLIVLAIFFIPISTFLSGLFYLCGIGFCLIFEKSRERILAVLQTQVFTIFAIFFIVLLLATIFGDGDFYQRAYYLKKYAEIGFAPLIAASFIDKRYQQWAIWAFSLAMLMTLLFSFATYFNFLGINSLLFGEVDSSNPTVFKFHIDQNFFMSLAIFHWLYLAIYASKKIVKAIFALIATLGIFNVLAMVQGRVGYLSLLIIIIILALQIYGMRGILYGSISSFLLAFGSYQLLPAFHGRVALGIAEIMQWQPGVGSETSMGLRLDFWSAAWEIVSLHPFFGGGLASYAYNNALLNQGTSLSLNANPHNQYLLFASQIGLFGLLLFIILNIILWWQAKLLPLFWQNVVRIVLGAYAVGNLFNSFQYDTAESLFFVMVMAVAFSQSNYSRT